MVIATFLVFGCIDIYFVKDKKTDLTLSFIEDVKVERNDQLIPDMLVDKTNSESVSILNCFFESA